MRRLGVWLLAVQALGCGMEAGEAIPRRALFSSPPADAVAEELEKPARLTVLYHPDVVACAPVELKVIRALNRLSSEAGDVRILTVLPRGMEALGTRYGEKLPGTVLAVSQEAYDREGNLSPRPRLEVWAGRRLLLIKSVPPVASEDALYEEILWTRSFTKPVQAAAR